MKRFKKHHLIWVLFLAVAVLAHVGGAHSREQCVLVLDKGAGVSDVRL